MTDQELIGYLERLDGGLRELSRKVDEKIDGLRDENRQTRIALEEEIRQTRVALEEGDRQTRVVMEDMRSDIRLLAEGLMGQGEIFARRETETLKMLEEVKASIDPLYRNLNRRVAILEEKAEREPRDVLEVIREKFGKR